MEKVRGRRQTLSGKEDQVISLIYDKHYIWYDKEPSNSIEHSWYDRIVSDRKRLQHVSC